MLVAALAVITVVLVVVSLQRPEVPDSGVVPSNPGTPDVSLQTPATPTPTATGDPEATISPANHLDVSQLPFAARALRGDCATGAPVGLELSADGGVTWVSAVLGDLDVRQILDVDVVDPQHIDLTVAVGNACTPTIVSTFTGGQFWESYPDRTAEKVFIAPGQPAVISSRGVNVPSPCAAIAEVADNDPALVVGCAEGVFSYDIIASSWNPISATEPIAIALDSVTGQLVVAEPADDACAGFVVTVFDSAPGVFTPGPRSCLPEPLIGPGAIAAAGGTISFWSDQGFRVSRDGGATWVRIN